MAGVHPGFWWRFQQARALKVTTLQQLCEVDYRSLSSLQVFAQLLCSQRGATIDHGIGRFSKLGKWTKPWIFGLLHARYFQDGSRMFKVYAGACRRMKKIFVFFAVYGTLCLLYIGYVGASLGTCRCTSVSSRCLLVCVFFILYDFFRS